MGILVPSKNCQKVKADKASWQTYDKGDSFIEHVVDIYIFMRGVDFLQNSSISLILSIMSLILRKYVNSFICLNIMSNIYIKRITSHTTGAILWADCKPTIKDALYSLWTQKKCGFSSRHLGYFLNLLIFLIITSRVQTFSNYSQGCK